MRTAERSSCEAHVAWAGFLALTGTLTERQPSGSKSLGGVCATGYSAGAGGGVGSTSMNAEASDGR